MADFEFYSCPNCGVEKLFWKEPSGRLRCNFCSHSYLIDSRGDWKDVTSDYLLKVAVAPKPTYTPKVQPKVLELKPFKKRGRPKTRVDLPDWPVEKIARMPGYLREIFMKQMGKRDLKKLKELVDARRKRVGEPAFRPLSEGTYEDPKDKQNQSNA